jgi:hypothetical protein
LSEETAPHLTPEEVDSLFAFTFQVAEAEQLNNGKYIGASQPLYWHRQKGNN